jgi:hypothetical protein
MYVVALPPRNEVSGIIEASGGPRHLLSARYVADLSVAPDLAYEMCGDCATYRSRLIQHHDTAA